MSEPSATVLSEGPSKRFAITASALVARVYQSLPPDVRVRTATFGQNYGQAGAIDLFGEHFDIFYCRGLKEPLQEIWPLVKRWD
jgi:hypothetical protein